MNIPVLGESGFIYKQVGCLVRECRKRPSASSKLVMIIVHYYTRERKKRDNHNEHCEIQWQIESSPPLSKQCHSNDMQMINGGGVGLIWPIPPNRYGLPRDQTHPCSDNHGFFARTLPPLRSLPSMDATAIQRKPSTSTEGSDAMTSRRAMDASLSKPALLTVINNLFFTRRYGACSAL